MTITRNHTIAIIVDDDLTIIVDVNLKVYTSITFMSSIRTGVATLKLMHIISSVQNRAHALNRRIPQ